MALPLSDVVMMKRPNQEAARTSDEVRRGRGGGGGRGTALCLIDEQHRSFVPDHPVLSANVQTEVVGGGGGGGAHTRVRVNSLGPSQESLTLC